MLSKHLDKNNLHHSYLIEGEREEVLPEVLKFINSLGIDTNNNSDFIHISLDSLKIEDARNLKSYASEKSSTTSKKIFLISANNFLLEAQNSLLKMFEEPIENTHFFVIVPDVNSLIDTLVSRFYFISAKLANTDEAKEAEEFINMPLRKRIEFIKELLAESAPTPEGFGVPTSDEDQNVGKDSARSKALKFLNALELTLHQKLVSKCLFDTKCFEHIFKVREFLRMPGSSAKTLMESVSLSVPEK